MTTKETIKEILDTWGFPVLQETEGTLLFRYQLSYIQLNITGDDDSAGIAVTLTNIFSADDDKKMNIALRTCNDLNYNLMQVKLYIDSDSDLVIASEFFYKPGEDMEFLLTLALNCVVSAKKKFIGKYRQIEEETDLMAELENE